MKKIFKSITLVVVATAIAVVSACIASNATAPEQMKVWVKGNIVYLETPDGNVWVHEVE